MIFKNFCAREMIDPQPFLEFCLRVNRSGWELINHPDWLEDAWKEFLSFTYMRMLAELESK